MAEKEILIRLVASFFLSFLLSLCITKGLIKKEKKKHVGQAIKEDIVPTHQKKKNTPTMGGIAIFLSAWVMSLLLGYSFLKDKSFISLFLISGSFFGIGFIDDYLKIKQKSGKGLSPLLRLVMEILISMGVLWYLGYQDQTLWRIHLLFQKSWKVGLLFIPLIVFILVGGANSMNMADGLDGLASGLAMNALFPFVLIALLKENYGVALFLVSLIGGIVGFLCFNFHPAKIFMGDTGSLALGGAFAAVTVYSGQALCAVMCGAMFVWTAMSVIIQVLHFKRTKRRVFKMAPFHHHLQESGLHENRIVAIYGAITLLFSISAVLFTVGVI